MGTSKMTISIVLKPEILVITKRHESTEADRLLTDLATLALGNRGPSAVLTLAKYSWNYNGRRLQLRIEVHFLFALGNKWHGSCVNLVKREALLKDLHAPVSFHFPMQTKKVYFNPYIFTLQWHSPAMKHKNCSKYFPMNATCHVEEILTLIFLRLFMAF